ncbi:VOC family protein [Photobacterium rosenbergii]|uniref:VOC family protein n=1 Tax=Photobacterium rosenbergii TaxID=294936 RepID=A0A2T3NJ38_9GAMM|nr:VOC family protein [Photobacterium rosenbergii]PSW15535.1 VOC family protein [Photobacterium rosenbergii]
MASVFEQHGAFSWSELMTDDPEKAIEFYRQVIGWEVEAMPMEGGTYHVIKAGGEPVGGIMGKPDGYENIPNHWGSYITVEDVDDTVASAKAAGGCIVYEPKDIPGVGRICAISDQDGAIVSVIAYENKECED